jgi:2-amino-4-hydroxy-6-hydroxymethyldihydropteridine diphosphokinase
VIAGEDPREVDAVIALGSNLGDREEIIRDAVRDIDELDGVSVTAASGLVETLALKTDGVDATAPTYLNAVIVVRTTLTARKLLGALNGIERAHGRTRDVRWGDRTLDLDIITFGDDDIAEPDLIVPHPRAWERAFVLAPWLEVDPNATISGRGSVSTLLANTGEKPTVYEAEALL